MRDAAIEIVPLNRDVAERARSATRTNGKGRRKARLNVGHRIALATAKLRDVPLLARCGDFQYTDVRMAAQ